MKDEPLNPEFIFTIVRWNNKTNDFSFLYCPDWDSADEPTIEESIKVSYHGKITKSNKKSDPQIYHQKWQFVGSDYTGFDIEESKQRTKDYQAAINEIAKKKGISTREISSKIGTLSYWEKEVVPFIKRQ